MRDIFAAINREGVAILFIEQNARLALSIAARGYILESGRLAAQGPAKDLLDGPDLKRIFLGG
jgi:branched-chain amino acid transport system ATP-binding protein